MITHVRAVRLTQAPSAPGSPRRPATSGVQSRRRDRGRRETLRVHRGVYNCTILQATRSRGASGVGRLAALRSLTVTRAPSGLLCSYCGVSGASARDVPSGEEGAEVGPGAGACVCR